MVEIQELTAGEKVSLRTSSKTWEGIVLESYDPEIVLLKLSSGYNIGIREREILETKVIEKAVQIEKQKTETTQNKKLPTAERSGQNQGKGELQENRGLPRIAMIITGGTISSRLDPKSGAVISTDAEEILNMAPEIKDIANITKIEKPFMKFSENMGPKDWKKLAETCEILLNDETISGIIITHGTDTMHFTSSALAFMLGKLNKPIALTYSQRSIDRGSTDASLNMICSAKYAISDIAELALVGHKDLNDEFCLAMPATKVRKMHTSRRDTFQIINSEPFAEISKKEFKILREFNARDNSRKIKADIKFESKVALVKIMPGQDPKILDFLAAEGYKGIILELFGLGQVPAQDSENNWLPTIKKTIEKGIIICGAPQTVSGRLNSNVYSTGRDLQKTGLIFLEDMLPETAFTKLGWTLGHSSWVKEKKVQEKMLENFVGEYNSKIGF